MYFRLWTYLIRSLNALVWIKSYKRKLANRIVQIYFLFADIRSINETYTLPAGYLPKPCQSTTEISFDRSE